MQRIIYAAQSNNTLIYLNSAYSVYKLCFIFINLAQAHHWYVQWSELPLPVSGGTGGPRSWMGNALTLEVECHAALHSPAALLVLVLLLLLLLACVFGRED